MRSEPSPLSGRVTDGPAELLHEHVLGPQFRFEARHLLRWYIAIEKALVVEYLRMGLVGAGPAAEIARLLDTAPSGLADADPAANLSDLAFALERHVEAGLTEPVPAWHVDRSRNDLQATAQRLFLRDQLREVAGAVSGLVTTVHDRAATATELPMPGYTHFQPAQITSPGFYLTALAGQLIHTLRRLLSTDALLDACPLGSGAMTGQQLDWDRTRLATLLGFARIEPHALTAVASRRGNAEVTAELSLLGVELSRFVTDLITWTGGDCRYLELPDSLSGISSAMPQKKNYPVLERIRGKTAHLTAFHLDVVLGQRNTPYMNLVEVSKEAATHVHDAVTTALLTLRLLTAVVDGLRFDAPRMRAACEREFLGGFGLANQLTLAEGVPWRRAQVIAGRYVVAAMAVGHRPADHDAGLLATQARAEGFTLAHPGAHLAAAFDIPGGLWGTGTPGSAHPDRVAELIAAQRDDHAALHRELVGRVDAARCALTGLDRVVVAAPPGATAPATA